MRIVFTVLLTVLLVGGLALYLDHRPASGPDTERESLEIINQKFVIEVTLSVEPVSAENASKMPEDFISLSLNGNNVEAEITYFSGLNKFRCEIESRINEGENEILVMPVYEEFLKSNITAARLEILNGSEILAQKTFWFYGEAPMPLVLGFAYSADMDEEDGHE